LPDPDPWKASKKHLEARESLPPDLRPIFDALVADYRFAATRRHNAPFVSYVVLADLIRQGWRLADPSESA